MRSIFRPSNSGSGVTEGVEFIWCVYGREPKIHEIWCLGSDSVTREVHPTAKIDVGAGTVGKFTTNYLAENGCRIPIIGQLSIKGSVKLFGIPNFPETVDCGLLITCKIPLWPLVGGDANTSYQNLGVTTVGPYSNSVVAWVSTVSACPYFMPRSPENLRISTRRVCDDLCCLRRLKL